MGLFTDLRAGEQSIEAFQAGVDRIPYAKFLGIQVVSLGVYRLLVKLPFDKKLVGNPMLPALHGGVLGAFLEIVAILQLVKEEEGDGLPKPINLTVDYLRSAGPRDLYGRATITKRGRRVANVRVEAWQEDPERPVAAAHGHFLMPV
ncbi:MAG: PaaI family thioesterase [Candidatus Binatia bacterium]